MRKLQCPLNAWIAVSESGYPALFLGYWLTRKQLKAHYSDRFPAEEERHGAKAFDKAGYRAVNVRIFEIGFPD
jgi:hypothetical protein